IRHDADALAVSRQLELMGERQVESAERASHIVRAYLMCQSDRIDDAQAELRMVGASDQQPTPERFRLEILRGRVQPFAGKDEAALLAYEHALDLASAIKSVPRETRALLNIAQVQTSTDSLDKAGKTLANARSLADENNDEAALAEISLRQSDVAARLQD